MISFGPAVALDHTADPAGIAPQGDDAPAQGGKLFGAVLAQMMGGANADASQACGDDHDLGVKGQADDDSAAKDDKSKDPVDPTALVNPFVVQGLPDVTLPLPMQLAATPVQSLPGSDDTATSPADKAAGKESTIGAQAALMHDAAPLNLDELNAFAEKLARENAKMTAAVTQSPNADAAKTQQPAIEGAEAAKTPQDAAPSAAPGYHDPQSSSTKQATTSARAAKSERAADDMKIAAPLSRPAGAAAVDRAYLSHDREPSKSFDSNRESAPAPRLQSIGQPAATTAFVAAMETHQAPAPALLTVDAPEPRLTMDASLDAQLPTQIVQSIRLQAIDGGGEAVLRLRPEYLGEVVVAVKVAQGSVTAALQADTPAVREWVERNEGTLRQALAEHGLQLDRLSVTDKPSETENDRDNERQSQEQQQPQSRRRRQQPDDATFEVTV